MNDEYGGGPGDPGEHEVSGASVLHSLQSEVQVCPCQVGTAIYALISMPAYDVEVASPLTSAEHDIALRILLGKSNEQIAEARGSSRMTVINQVRAIFEKLGVDSRTQLARKLVPSLSITPSPDDCH